MSRRAGTVAGLALGFIASLVVPTARAESPALAKIKKTGAITLGYRESSIPFSYLDQNQKPVGFSIDLCAPVVERIRSELKLDKLEVKLQPVNSSNRIPLIQNGTIDIECGGTSSSLARLKQVSFTVATFVSSPRWLTKRSLGIADMKGLDGKTIAVTQGSNAAGFAQAFKAKGATFEIVQARDHAESLLMVQTGRAAAFLEDDILLAGLKARAPNKDDLVFLPETFDSVPYGLMLPRGDSEFKALADGVLKEMMASGAFMTLYDKWFQSPIAPYGDNLNFPPSEALKERIAKPSDKVDS
ncbi:amino acid ABC transporter substrate-binding protein [Enterovirga rhinocerotis]|uniref:Glutamate/aspartate transport system substrate-binding protein n=1 Tax=Enterovirga rhinocerotis TaxID=1339210 RepID=A0A4R7BWM3_9HYPH|nr:amino acid ABC transporter substrate-binding protein [Enterovirga rhinocerotis]TDR89582.1 glutamate/aspartate transport system substrate-binding protein [Enterovirga rhinocerotis]